MRQPVLVGVDADQVLERAGEPDLFMGLELGDVDQDIRIHRRATEKILMSGVLVHPVGFLHVEGSTIKSAESVVADKLTGLVQRNAGRSEWISGQFDFGNGHAINGMPFLGA